MLLNTMLDKVHNNDFISLRVDLRGAKLETIHGMAGVIVYKAKQL